MGLSLKIHVQYSAAASPRHFSAFRKCHVHIDVVVGVGHSLLCPYRARVLLPTPGLMELSSAALTWEHAQDLSLETCCLPVNLGALVPEGQTKPSESWGGRPPGIRPQFEKSPSESRLLYLTLHSTCASS